ncbi:hypothetical protein, partial [Pseudomonas sp. CBZ-4]|uniref:hypothetical protein n=1 Tax=Pseudomonas sp. CBZ-4 TaxID=1163065 RepID=UPI001C4585C4
IPEPLFANANRGFVLGGRKASQASTCFLSLPLGKSIQSVSTFLLWCSTFSQGLIFHPQDAASPFFNEML